MLTRADILPSQAVYSRGSQYNSGREGAEGRRSKCGETGEASGAWERLPVNFPPRRSHNVQWCWATHGQEVPGWSCSCNFCSVFLVHSFSYIVEGS